MFRLLKVLSRLTHFKHSSQLLLSTWSGTRPRADRTVRCAIPYSISQLTLSSAKLYQSDRPSPPAVTRRFWLLLFLLKQFFLFLCYLRLCYIFSYWYFIVSCDHRDKLRLKWTAIDRNSLTAAARQTSDWQSEMRTAWRAVVHTVLCWPAEQL